MGVSRGPLGTHLQELGADFELWRVCARALGLVPAPLDALEELLDGARDDALLLHRHTQVKARAHRVRLPRARLEPHEKHTSLMSHTHTHTHTHNRRGFTWPLKLPSHTHTPLERSIQASNTHSCRIRHTHPLKMPSRNYQHKHQHQLGIKYNLEEKKHIHKNIKVKQNHI